MVVDLGVDLGAFAGPGDGHRGALGGDRPGHGRVAERVHDPSPRGGAVLPPALRGDGARRLHLAGRVRRQDEVRAGLLLRHDDAVRDRAGAGAHQGVQ